MPPACRPPRFRTFAEKINWDKPFSRARLSPDSPIRRKQDRRDFLINAPLGFKHGLSGPNGFNSGQGVGLLLDRIAFPESGIASFDDLPIPFRCVATDMQSGEAVVLRDGSLARSGARLDGHPRRIHSRGDQRTRAGGRRHGAKHSRGNRARLWMPTWSSPWNCVFPPATSRNSNLCRECSRAPST